MVLTLPQASQSVPRPTNPMAFDTTVGNAARSVLRTKLTIEEGGPGITSMIGGEPSSPGLTNTADGELSKRSSEDDFSPAA